MRAFVRTAPLMDLQVSSLLPFPFSHVNISQSLKIQGTDSRASRHGAGDAEPLPEAGSDPRPTKPGKAPK